MNKAKLGFLSAMAVFGTVGLFVAFIPAPSATIACFRGAMGLVVLLLIKLLTGKKLDISAIQRNLFLLLMSGAAIGGNWILLFESYRLTGVATGTICYYMAPVFLILASPLLGEQLTVKKLILCGTALLGMVFVSGVLSGGDTNFPGIASGLGAAVLYASVMFMNKKLGEIPSNDKTIVQLGAAAVVILPYCLLSGGFGLSAMTDVGWAHLAVVGVIHTGLCYWLYFGTMSKLPSQTVALFSYLDPVLSIILAALLLKEPFGWQGAVGAVLILGSALCSEIPTQKIAKKG